MVRRKVYLSSHRFEDWLKFGCFLVNFFAKVSSSKVMDEDLTCPQKPICNQLLGARVEKYVTCSILGKRAVISSQYPDSNIGVAL